VLGESSDRAIKKGTERKGREEREKKEREKGRKEKGPSAAANRKPQTPTTRRDTLPQLFTHA
jgi:hypothetical protein